MKNSKKVLFIALVWPEPDSSAAGTRILQLASLFQTEGYEVAFASAAQQTEYQANLEALGYATFSISLNDASFDTWVHHFNPDVVVFDRFVSEEQFGWRVAENCPQALRILDSEDLHFLRFARQKAVQSGLPFSVEMLYSDMAKRELASLLRCDLTLVISEYEMELLQEHFNISSEVLFYLPLFYEISQQHLSFNKRNGFMFIGNFIHEPNWDAVKQLATIVWPRIKKMLPQAQLHIYGAYPFPKVLQLHNPENGFWVMGRAASAKEVIAKSRVMLAPLRFGAGLKGKLIEAMANGTPTVTTSIGAEGIQDGFEWNGFVEDDFYAFADKAIALYTDEFLWNNAVVQGQKILTNRFKRENFVSGFHERIYDLHMNLTTHRRAHFIGSILLHHTVNGVRYLSKWIEEKNKK